MKWFEVIKNLILDSKLSREALVLLVDVGFMIGKLTADMKTELLSDLNTTTYDITMLIDNIASIYEDSDLLDEDMVSIALMQYVRKSIITSEKRMQIISSLIKK